MEYVKRLNFLTFLSEAEVLIGNIWYNPMSQYQDTSMPASLLSLTFFFFLSTDQRSWENLTSVALPRMREKPISFKKRNSNEIFKL